MKMPKNDIREFRCFPLETAIVRGAFWHAVGELQSSGFEVISSLQLADLAMAYGEAVRGSYVKEAVIYSKSEKKSFVVRNSPFLTRNGLDIIKYRTDEFKKVDSYSAKWGRRAHAGNENAPYDYFGNDEIDELLAGTEKCEYPTEANCLMQWGKDVPCKRFGEDPLTVFLIGGGDSNKAQVIGDDFKNRIEQSSIKFYPFSGLRFKFMNNYAIGQLYFNGLNHDERIGTKIFYGAGILVPSIEHFYGYDVYSNDPPERNIRGVRLPKK